MTLTFSSPRNLTESLCQKDESIPLIEEPIGTALLRAADRYGQQIALVDGALDVDNRRSWTFEALASDAKRVAHALLERFAPGDHIALWAANCPDWVLIELGAASLLNLLEVGLDPVIRHENFANGSVTRREPTLEDMANASATRQCAPVLVKVRSELTTSADRRPRLQERSQARRMIRWRQRSPTCDL
jgi:acyl-CoA synthetase (AMP-forming)/AMP-acid ligase II